MVDRNQYRKTDYTINSIVPGVKLIETIARKVKNAIIDYALGAAILGAIPVYGRWIPLLRVALLIVLILKMVKDIRRFWGDRQDRRVRAVFSCILGIIGSVALALIAWLGVLLLSLLIPFIDVLARAIAYGVLTFNIGLTMSRYHYSPLTSNLKALQKALKSHQSPRI